MKKLIIIFIVLGFLSCKNIEDVTHTMELVDFNVDGEDDYFYGSFYSLTDGKYYALSYNPGWGGVVGIKYLKDKPTGTLIKVTRTHEYFDGYRWRSLVITKENK